MLQIENEEHLQRDMENRSVVNTNLHALEAAKKAKNRKQQNNKRLDLLEERFDRLESLIKKYFE